MLERSSIYSTEHWNSWGMRMIFFFTSAFLIFFYICLHLYSQIYKKRIIYTQKEKTVHLSFRLIACFSLAKLRFHRDASIKYQLLFSLPRCQLHASKRFVGIFLYVHRLTASVVCSCRAQMLFAREWWKLLNNSQINWTLALMCSSSYP